MGLVSAGCWKIYRDRKDGFTESCTRKINKSYLMRLMFMINWIQSYGNQRMTRGREPKCLSMKEQKLNL